MNKNMKIVLKDSAKEILVISSGCMAGSLLLAIGISLCIGQNWIGVVPIISGYEMLRLTFIFLIKNRLRVLGILK